MLYLKKNDTLLKSGINGHFVGAIARQNSEKWPIFGAELKNTKDIQKTIHDVITLNF